MLLVWSASNIFCAVLQSKQPLNVEMEWFRDPQTEEVIILVAKASGPSLYLTLLTLSCFRLFIYCDEICS